jgi:hypothetical protein
MEFILSIGRPRIEAQTEVVEATTNRHHHVARRIFPEPNHILDHAAALDRADHLLNPHPTMRNHLVLGFLRIGDCLFALLFVRLCDLDAVERKTDKPKVWQ